MRLARKLLTLLAAAPAAAVMLAAPASAGHPELPPQNYSAFHLASDPCTWYDTIGEVAFPAVHPPEDPTAIFTGSFGIFVADPPPGESCPPTAPGGRVAEFTAYVDDVPVAEQVVPVEFEEPYEYEVELTSENGIDYVTIAVCAVEEPDEIDRCGEPDTIYTSGPTTPYCLYDYTIVNAWGSGWQGEVSLTPLVDPGEDWLIVITLPDGTTIDQGWKAQITWLDDEVRFTPPAWSSPIPVGGSFGPGFIGSGPIPPDSNVTAYVNDTPCDPA